MGESGKKARILVVEDESIVALDMRNQLSEMGYEVVGMASSGEDAIASALTAQPDLVLMDIRLKGEMDGVEAAERIRNERDIPVIFITAYADERTLSRAKVTQAFGYILKPFQGREVLISIEMALYKHRIERELRDNREWLKGTLNAITDAVIALDGEDRIKYMNRSAESLFRMDDASVRGKALSELCTFSESSALTGFFATQREGQAKGNESWVVMELPSRKLPVELVRTSIPGGKDGSPSGTVLAIRDISELVRSVETRSRLAAIVANSYDAILAVGADLRIASWNFGAELMYGYSSAEMIGKSLLELLSEEGDRTQLRAIADQVLAGHEAERFDSARKCRSGKIIPVSVSLSPVRDAEGQVVELACIERDVSAEKEYEASLVKAKLAAEEASRAKGEFLSNMSHELRTPLNSIIGMIDLSRDGAANEEQSEYLDIARQSADNLLFLINSILDFSKIESGKMRINAVPFNLVEAVADCIEPLAVQAYQKGLYFRFRFDPDCPNKVIGDSHRLQQILVNLFSNAIKFTEAGGVRIDLTFLRKTDSDGIVATFAVRDTGIGIPRDRLDVIWDKFTQLDGSSTRSYGGTGLGLAIVKSLVELMGGTVEVESEIERGSVFTVELPFSLAAGAAPEVGRIDELAGAEVVIVSPEAPELAILSELLSAWGCAPLELGDAAALVDRLSRNGVSVPRLVLADENVGARNRLLACSENESCLDLLRNRLVVLTEGVGPKDPFWRGWTSHSLVKPVRPEALLAILRMPLVAVQGGPPHVGQTSMGAIENGKGTKKPEGSEEEMAINRIQEINSDPKVKFQVERFLQENEPLGDVPSVRLETSAGRYRKTLEDLRTHELPRSLFKVILACRRDDADGVKSGLESIRSALRSCEGAGR